MSIQRLADIELQLCMHGMLALERLQFARCSRRLLHAAASPFAWKYVQPLQVKAASLSSPSLIAIVKLEPSLPIAPPSSLLRHIPLHLQWTNDRAHVLPQSALVGLDLLQRADAQVHSFDTSRCRDVQPALLRVLLLHPLMRHLRLLRLHDPSAWSLTDHGVLHALVSQQPMSHLHTLHMLESIAPDCAEAFMQMLSPMMPTLTSLHVHAAAAASHWKLHEQLFEFIERCSLLTHLGLTTSAGLPFDAFFTRAANNLRQLQSLTLQRFNAAGTDANDRPPEYATAFAALDQLRVLELIDIYSPDALLSHLHSAVALRLVTLRCAVAGGGLMHPTPPVVASMLSQSSSLKCALVLVCDKASQKQVAVGVQRHWQQRAELRDARKSGKRIVVTIEDEEQS